MNKNYYSPICRRSDGSVYLDKNCFWKNFLGGAAAVLLLSLFFTAVVMFTFVDPFGVEAERRQNPARSSQVSLDKSASALRSAR